MCPLVTTVIMAMKGLVQCNSLGCIVAVILPPLLYILQIWTIIVLVQNQFNMVDYALVYLPMQSEIKKGFTWTNAAINCLW